METHYTHDLKAVNWQQCGYAVETYADEILEYIKYKLLCNVIRGCMTSSFKLLNIVANIFSQFLFIFKALNDTCLH